MGSHCSSTVRDLISKAQKRGTKFYLSCLGILVTVLFGGWTLRLTIDQRHLAWEATKLAEWTAKKDFREICQDQAVSGGRFVSKCCGGADI